MIRLNFARRSQRLRPPGICLRSAAVLVCALALAGCGTLTRDWDRKAGPGFRPQNYADAGPIPQRIRRVGILPLYSEQWRPSDVAPLEAALAAELGKFARFEVLGISRRELDVRFDREAFVSAAALPGDFLPRLRQDFGTDAVLFLDLTHYSPYQPLAIGLRAKLVDAATGEMLWSFDSIFDAAQPDVAVAARRYHEQQSRPAHPMGNASGILQSPARFAKYVASAMFETLPMRQSGEITQNH